ncbi:hypothetical protein Daesc_009024 [Daldinia eschscholtzii]|uniref:Histone chaperone domain-containing protein n=1 Tax=Daldinia eschscholtzii TaxID=292717 RepID=A0AAX6M9S4_9PEZI
MPSYKSHNSTATTSTSTSSPSPLKPKRETESPVSEQSDQDTIESPADEIVDDYVVKLGKDDREAIDPSNIISERTRHAKPINGSYILSDDEEDEDENGVVLREDGTAVSADAAASLD